MQIQLNQDELRVSRSKLIEEEIESLRQTALAGFSADCYGPLYFTLPAVAGSVPVETDQPDGFGERSRDGGTQPDVGRFSGFQFCEE